MKCLVTGGAGFIGSAVCRYLITCGCTVINLDKLTYAANLASLASIAASPAIPVLPGRHMRPRCGRCSH